MSTLAQIETAVTSLPASEQERLLVWLQSIVRRGTKIEEKPRADRQEWLQRLAALRERGRTGRDGTPLQQIMDELRGE